MLYFPYERKRSVSFMAEWTPDFDMTGVSISEPDKAAGSPKEGDFVAINPKNTEDRWLVSKEYFEQNFEPHPGADPFG